MSFVFCICTKTSFCNCALRLPIAKRGKETGIAILCMKLCGIIYKALLYSVPEITGMKCGKNKENKV